jgi:hypothetical protein
LKIQAQNRNLWRNLYDSYADTEPGLEKKAAMLSKSSAIGMVTVFAIPTRASLKLSNIIFVLILRRKYWIPVMPLLGVAAYQRCICRVNDD